MTAKPKSRIIGSFKDPHVASRIIQMWGLSQGVKAHDASTVMFDDCTIFMEPVEGYAKQIYYQIKVAFKK
jgi:hypothetical protein